MLLARERWRSFVNSWWRPLGVPAQGELNSLARNGSGFPRMPRFLTALLLLASLAIVLLPDTRRIIGTVVSHYRGNPWDFDVLQSGTLRKLKDEASRNEDPKLLAFFYLLDPSGASDSFGEKAIQKDPSLTWIEYGRSHWGTAEAQKAFLASLPNAIARLQKWDPDNAASYLLESQRIAETKRLPGWNEGIIVSADRPEPALERDSEWLAAMDRAFSASKYDNYLTREFDLLRDVSERYRIDDPELITEVIAGRFVANVGNALTYADALVRRGVAAEGRGDYNEALANYRKIERFGHMMHLSNCNGGNLGGPCMIALRCEQRAETQLQPLLQKMGRGDEATLASFQLANAYETESSWSYSSRGQRLPEEWSGLLIQLAVPLILLLFSAVLVAWVLIWSRRRNSTESRGWFQSLLCGIADVAPPLLLFVCAALFFTYHPYAQEYRISLSRARTFADLRGLWDVSLVSRSLPGGSYSLQTLLFGVYGSVVLWATIIAVLSGVAATLIYRMAKRQEPSITTNA